MNRQRQFRKSDRMGDLICRHSELISVLSRFNIPLGFGDKSVAQVCEINHIDCDTFLTVANFLIDENIGSIDHLGNLSLSNLTLFLTNAHSYFRMYKFPMIRTKLNEVISTEEPAILQLVLNFFDKYFLEVMKHMNYEEKIVFGYVDELLTGVLSNHYSIDTFKDKHNEIDSKLTDLKNMLIKYIPVAAGKNNNLNDVLMDIFNCEKELEMHTRIEDFLFIPAIAKLEKELSTYGNE
ncbi:MAG: hemerythrin domain-containing protein [Bacteroidales bacterium]